MHSGARWPGGGADIEEVLPARALAVLSAARRDLLAERERRVRRSRRHRSGEHQRDGAGTGAEVAGVGAAVAKRAGGGVICAVGAAREIWSA
jgi:hypothetical protein